MKLVLLCLLFILAAVHGMRDQSIAVKGRLVCGDKPAANVRIKLWEEDSGPDPDDLLEAGYTDANGEFQLSGGEAELTPIDPIFKVYHDCDDKFTVRTELKFKEIRWFSAGTPQGQVPDSEVIHHLRKGPEEDVRLGSSEPWDHFPEGGERADCVQKTSSSCSPQHGGWKLINQLLTCYGLKNML